MNRILSLIFLLWCGAANAQLSGGLMFPGPGTAHSAGGGGTSFTATANPAHIYNGFGSTSTFTGVSTGSGTVIITTQILDSSATATSVTLNGVTMNLAVKSTRTSNREVGIYYLAGQSANANSTVVVTGGAQYVVGIQASVLSGVNATPTATAFTNYSQTGVTNYDVGPITVPSSGFGIASNYFDYPTGGLSAGTGVTIDYDLPDGTDLQSILSHVGPGASQTNRLVGGNFLGFGAAFAAWGP